PMQTRHNLDAILERAGMRGLPVLLIGLEAPRNLGPDYKTAFDGIYPELAAAHGTLLFPSFLAPLREGRDTAGILEDLMQADGIHPNAAGVEVIVAALGPMVLRLIDRSTKVAE
ncbi:MAG: arylesterase, partial [Paracoccaceae bacterium]